MTAAAKISGAGPDEDARFMQAAIDLGGRELGQAWPNPSVGALVVRDGVIVGRGWTKQGGRPHAEAVALADAGEAARGATLYVSLEPCSHHGRTPPCADAIVAAGVTRVVSALKDPNPLVAGEGYARLRAAGIEVTENVLIEKAAQMHAGHISRIVKKRPYVTLKMALSSDGKAAFAGPRPAPITGETVRDKVHMMRARTDAIAVGIGTVLADDPLLTCRLSGMEDRSPVRVVFDSGLRISGTSQIVMTARAVPVWMIADTGASRETEISLAPHGIEVIRVPFGDDGVDLPAAIGELSDRGITRLMVEGGPRLAAGFLRAGLVDEAVIFQSSDPLGAEAVDALPGPHGEVMQRAGLGLREKLDAGGDVMFVYERY